MVHIGHKSYLSSECQGCVQTETKSAVLFRLLRQIIEALEKRNATVKSDTHIKKKWKTT